MYAGMPYTCRAAAFTSLIQLVSAPTRPCTNACQCRRRRHRRLLLHSAGPVAGRCSSVTPTRPTSTSGFAGGEIQAAGQGDCAVPGHDRPGCAGGQAAAPCGSASFPQEGKTSSCCCCWYHSPHACDIVAAATRWEMSPAAAGCQLQLLADALRICGVPASPRLDSPRLPPSSCLCTYSPTPSATRCSSRRWRARGGGRWGRGGLG